MRDAVVGGGDLLISTVNNSMVLKFPDDPIRAGWDLLAGPCKHQILDLQLFPDGSLVALDRSDSFIMIYPSSNF